MLQSYRRMFATVRLVDPGLCLQISADAHGHRLEQSAHCYAIWGKERRCSNCIAQEAIRTRRTQSKIESAGSDIFYVLALCAEIDGVPYALECANPLQSSGSEENLLNQLLVRNRQVYIDSATKVFNRRYYDTRIRGLTGAYALAMFDIDDFKAVNDTFGHAAGDLALYHVAQTVRAKLRGSDEIIRYGGDEFFLLFHGLPGHILERKLQALCQAVAQIELSDYPALRLSISIGGIAAAGRIAELVQKADRALYQAKKTKGCAVIYKEDSHAST